MSLGQIIYGLPCRAALLQQPVSLADHLLSPYSAQEGAWVHFRACCFDQAHVVSPNDLIVASVAFFTR